MTIGEKIKKARELSGLSYSQLADKSGLKKSTLQRYETGTTHKIPIEAIEILESTLGLAPGSLMGWEDKRNNSNAELSLEKYGLKPIIKKKIPLLGEIACGEPIYASEDRESYVAIGTDIGADFCLRAKGDSMINARINDGDIVFIRHQSMVNNGEIAAVIIDDSATLKRVYYYPEKQKLVLNAENPKYEPLVYVGAELDEIHILGKAIAFQSDVI